MVKWQGGGFPALFKSRGHRVRPRFYIMATLAFNNLMSTEPIVSHCCCRCHCKTPKRSGFECVQKLSYDFVECICTTVTTAKQMLHNADYDCDDVTLVFNSGEYFE